MKLEVGYNHAFEIRRETLQANCKDNFSVLFLSDLHFNGHSEKMVERILSAIHELQPALILFGGDYADSGKGLAYLDRLTSSISGTGKLFAIAGNHDYAIGIDRVRKIMLANNVAWIEGSCTRAKIGSTTINITGNPDERAGDADISILLLHEPRHPEILNGTHQLAFAGHLHGSQFVFWQKGNALYPGKLFYRWNILKAGDSPYFISKGLGDTLPIRYNCKRDMIFVEVVANQNSR